MTAKLQQTLERLYGLERRKDKLGLEGTEALLGALGDPHRRFRSVHVAGTNGKGSVCALVERVLREAGHRTGLFTSPHLVDFRERIRVNGRWADQGWLERTLDHVATLPEGRDRTFFEVATALGFLDFAARGVEWAVVEVGLGGRLDCTNVLEPDVTVITSIGLDHTEILGDTIEQIAREKAGILKPGVPLVSGVPSGPAAIAIAAAAAERGVAIVEARDREDGSNGAASRRLGRFWGRTSAPAPAEPGLGLNASIALATLETLARGGLSIPWSAVEKGFAVARWPGRLERCPSLPRLWWDGAHNEQAARSLAAMWEGVEPPGALVLAFSRDKDARGFLEALRPRFATARVIATQTRNPRALPAMRLGASAREVGYTVHEASDVPSAVRMGLDVPGDGPVLLTGSLFAVGEAMEAFGGAPGEWL